MSIDRLKPANAEPKRPIEPALPPRRGRPSNQRVEHPAAQRGQANTRPAPGPEEGTPTYAQVTRRGRAVRPPERYIAVASDHLPATRQHQPSDLGRRWGGGELGSGAPGSCASAMRVSFTSRLIRPLISRVSLGNIFSSLARFLAFNSRFSILV